VQAGARDPGGTETQSSACRDEVRKAKAHLELSLLKGMKCGRQGFYGDISSKRKSRENVGLLLNGIRDQVTNHVQEARVLSAFVASVFTDETCFKNPGRMKSVEKYGAMKTYPWCEGGIK